MRGPFGTFTTHEVAINLNKLGKSFPASLGEAEDLGKKVVQRGVGEEELTMKGIDFLDKRLDYLLYSQSGLPL